MEKLTKRLLAVTASEWLSLLNLVPAHSRVILMKNECRCRHYCCCSSAASFVLQFLLLVPYMPESELKTAATSEAGRRFVWWATIFSARCIR